MVTLTVTSSRSEVGNIQTHYVFAWIAFGFGSVDLRKVSQTLLCVCTSVMSRAHGRIETLVYTLLSTGARNMTIRMLF